MITSTTQFISVTSRTGFREANLFDATLTDDDLIRGDDTNATVISDGFEIFNGFTTFGFSGTTFRDGEVETTVTFADGTILEGVLGLTDRFSGGFSNTNLYLLDQQTLADAGKTLADVMDVQTTWCDCGGRSPGRARSGMLASWKKAVRRTTYGTLCRFGCVTERDFDLCCGQGWQDRRARDLPC